MKGRFWSIFVSNMGHWRNNVTRLFLWPTADMFCSVFRVCQTFSPILCQHEYAYLCNYFPSTSICKRFRSANNFYRLFNSLRRLFKSFHCLFPSIGQFSLSIQKFSHLLNSFTVGSAVFTVYSTVSPSIQQFHHLFKSFPIY